MSRTSRGHIHTRSRFLTTSAASQLLARSVVACPARPDMSEPIIAVYHSLRGLGLLSSGAA